MARLFKSAAGMGPTSSRYARLGQAPTGDLQNRRYTNGGVDLAIITAGIGHENPDLAWRPEAETIAVNVTGFAAMAGVAMRHFIARGSGHLVGISSIAGIRGDGRAPAYGASKAFVARYLQALRHKVAKQKLPLHITDIQAGFVDTAMAQGGLTSC